MNESPTFQEVELFVRNFTGLRPSRPILPSSRLDSDLGITGDDGGDMLQAASEHFRVQLADPVHGYRKTFRLGENEYLFHDEGLDLLGIGVLIRWLTRQPPSQVRDPTMLELHEAILRAKALDA